MRYWLLLPACLAAAACSGDEPAADNAAAQTPAAMPAGQYDIGYEVKSFRSTDNQKPAIDAKVGDKASGSGCVGDSGPPPELFVGQGYKCSYKTSYMKEGMINGSLSCTREGVTGEMGMTVQGSYTATGFEATVDTTSFLPGPGDFAMSSKVTGRLVGPSCAAAPAGDAAGNGSATKAG